jgi:hypothetical protein
MWNANNIVALTDPIIREPCFEMEILRYIHVGLLCVCKNLLKLGHMYLLLFPCLKVRPSIYLNQSDTCIHRKANCSRMLGPLNTTKVNAPLTMLLITMVQGR